MDGLIAYALAKKYTDKVGQDIISAGFKVQVEDNRSILNRQGEEKVLYLLPKEYSSSQDGYDEFVYANNAWEWIGKTDVSLDYESLENKPQINGVELTGNKTASDLSLQDKLTAGDNITISEENVISAEGGATSYSDLTDKPRINGYILSGNKFADELSLQGKLTAGNNITIDENNRISADGGAQIVSGVVNANGTITFTDSEGGSFTTSGSNLVTSGNEQISMGYDNGGFYFLFDDGQEEVNNGTD